jgi:hypothetical protein
MADDSVVVEPSVIESIHAEIARVDKMLAPLKSPLRYRAQALRAHEAEPYRQALRRAHEALASDEPNDHELELALADLRELTRGPWDPKGHDDAERDQDQQ